MPVSSHFTDEGWRPVLTQGWRAGTCGWSTVCGLSTEPYVLSVRVTNRRTLFLELRFQSQTPNAYFGEVL